MFADWTLTLQIANATLSFAIVTLLFAFIYRILPNATIGWTDVWFGALVTALLFEVGKDLISVYLGASTINTTSVQQAPLPCCCYGSTIRRKRSYLTLRSHGCTRTRLELCASTEVLAFHRRGPAFPTINIPLRASRF